jgi:hypothetical protein
MIKLLIRLIDITVILSCLLSLTISAIVQHGTAFLAWSCVLGIYIRLIQVQPVYSKGGDEHKVTQANNNRSTNNH